MESKFITSDLFPSFNLHFNFRFSIFFLTIIPIAGLKPLHENRKEKLFHSIECLFSFKCTYKPLVTISQKRQCQSGNSWHSSVLRCLIQELFKVFFFSYSMGYSFCKWCLNTQYFDDNKNFIVIFILLRNYHYIGFFPHFLNKMNL